MVKKLSREFVKNTLDTFSWVLLDFHNTRKPLKCRCPEGHIQHIYWRVFKAGYPECNVCCGKHTTKKLTYLDVCGQFLERNLLLLESYYRNAHTKMKFTCLTCGYTDYKSLVSLKNTKFGCPKCSGKKKYTLDEAKTLFLNNGLLLISTYYVANNKPLKSICLYCGKENHLSLSSVLSGARCKKCAIDKTRLKYSEVSSRFKNQGFKLLDTSYDNNRQLLTYECLNCGYIGKKSLLVVSQGYECPKCSNIKRAIAVQGDKSGFWKGGVISKQLPLYETYADKLAPYHKTYIIKRDSLKLLGVNCIYCGKVFVPTLRAVKNRLQVINGKQAGEQNFYCSAGCKKACPTYKQRKFPKGFKTGTSREVQKQLRQLVLKRDNYICQRCGSTDELHCHHITGIKMNPIESADIDNCITLCKKCHKYIHTLVGCSYNDLKCNN